MSISVSSLQPSEYEEWGIKEGGGHKNWKKRYFVLKERKLWYFETKTSYVQKGFIDLPPTATVQEVNDNKGKCMLSIKSRGAKGERKFLIEVADRIVLASFIKHVQNSINPQPKPNYIESLMSKQNQPTTQIDTTPRISVLNVIPEHKTPVNVSKEQTALATEMAKALGVKPRNGSNSKTIQSPRSERVSIAEKKESNIKYPKIPERSTANGKENVSYAKEMFSWITDDKAKLFDLWIASVPDQSCLKKGDKINYQMFVSSDAERVSFSCDGEQSLMIQGVMDFFIAVESSTSGIEKLNTCGNEICPEFIGSYIDLSTLGALEGGWSFVGDTMCHDAMKLMDNGNALLVLKRFETECPSIKIITKMERDMTAVGLECTRFEFDIYGKKGLAKLDVVQSVLSKFGGINHMLREEFKKIIIGLIDSEVSMALTLTTNDVARVSVLIRNPSSSVVSEILDMDKNSNIEMHNDLMKSFGKPTSIEYCIVLKGFSFDIYQENININVHYNLGYDE
ncbi:PH domain-containing protein [Entamoeba marina]